MVDGAGSDSGGALPECSFFVGPSESLLDRFTESVEKRPEYRDRLELNKSLQEPIPESGRIEGFKGDWARVASLSLPIDMVARVLEPGFFKDKKVFYQWLSRHPQYCVYDRRAAAARRPFNGWSFDGT